MSKLSKSQINKARAEIAQFDFNSAIKDEDFNFTNEVKGQQHTFLHFNYWTDYTSLSSQERLVPNTFHTDIDNIPAGQHINKFAFSLGVKKSLPVQVSMVYDAKFMDYDEMLDFSLSAFSLTQENKTRYFLTVENWFIKEYSQLDFIKEISGLGFKDFEKELKVKAEKSVLSDSIAPAIPVLLAKNKL